MYVDSLGNLARSREYHVRRREPRYVASIPVTLQRFARFGPVVTRGLSLDVSMRGMSALVCGAPRVGGTVVIGLSCPTLRSRCWRRSATAARLALDLSSTLCLPVPNIEFSTGSRNCASRKKSCFPFRMWVPPAVTKPCRWTLQHHRKDCDRRLRRRLTALANLPKL
jgi:hypothetical protein